MVDRSVSDNIAGLQAVVLAEFADSVLPQCAVVTGIRCLDNGSELPKRPRSSRRCIVRCRELSKAAEQPAQYIVHELADHASAPADAMNFKKAAALK